MAQHRPVRLGILLAFLLAAVLALLSTRGLLAGDASAGNVAIPCAGRAAPQVTEVGPGALASMRRAALTLVPAQLDRPDEQGLIGTENLWSDNDPTPLGRAQPGQPRGGYEVRAWGLDPAGREDHIGVDVLRYADAGDARAVFSLATDPRCRRAAAVRAAAFPSDGRLMTWTNPDRAYEQDVLFVRGATLYRVIDVPPGLGSRPAEAAQLRAERKRLPTVTEVLACSLPASRCPSAAVAAAAVAAGPPAAQAPSSPASPADALAFARQVLIRPFDLGYMTVAARAASGTGHTTPAGSLPACARGFPRAHAAAWARSPTFIFRQRRDWWTVASWTAVLPSEALAARFLAVAKSPGVRRCVLGAYRKLLAREATTSPRTHVAGVTLSTLATPTPDSYRGAWPYRPASTRLAIELTRRTRRGRLRETAVYQDEFQFVYRRALVGLSIFSVGEPLSTETKRYLEGVLVGRVEAAWGTAGAAGR